MAEEQKKNAFYRPLSSVSSRFYDTYSAATAAASECIYKYDNIFERNRKVYIFVQISRYIHCIRWYVVHRLSDRS